MKRSFLHKYLVTAVIFFFLPLILIFSQKKSENDFPGKADLYKAKKYALEYLDLPVRHKVFIPFVSAYHKTGQLAHKIAEGIRLAGDFDVEVLIWSNRPSANWTRKLPNAPP